MSYPRAVGPIVNLLHNQRNGPILLDPLKHAGMMSLFKVIHFIKSRGDLILFCQEKQLSPFAVPLELVEG